MLAHFRIDIVEIANLLAVQSQRSENVEEFVNTYVRHSIQYCRTAKVRQIVDGTVAVFQRSEPFTGKCSDGFNDCSNFNFLAGKQSFEFCMVFDIKNEDIIIYGKIALQKGFNGLHTGRYLRIYLL